MPERLTGPWPTALCSTYHKNAILAQFEQVKGAHKQMFSSPRRNRAIAKTFRLRKTIRNVHGLHPNVIVHVNEISAIGRLMQFRIGGPAACQRDGSGVAGWGPLMGRDGQAGRIQPARLEVNAIFTIPA